MEPSPQCQNKMENHTLKIWAITVEHDEILNKILANFVKKREPSYTLVFSIIENTMEIP